MLEAAERHSNKQDFLRILLENGFLLFSHEIEQKILCFRVDPTLKDPDDKHNPSAIEYAVLEEVIEALVIMQEFVEIPNDVKFKRLARLMDAYDGQKAKKEFAEMLRTMPVDLVRQENLSK